MQQTITRFLAQHHIDPSAKFIVALSGGADSIALLHACKYLNLHLLALHCNFNLRGKESNMDEQFVKRFCHTYGIPLSVRKFDTRAHAASRGISIEMAARELRYAWFEETRLKRKFDYILVAHHADDNAETTLLNLTRGTGIRGLTGIPPVSGRVLRPILTLSRQHILDYISSNQLGYRTDSTNNTLDYTRNKIRHLVMPVLKQINPSLLKTLEDTHRALRDTEQIYLHGIAALRRDTVHVENGETLVHIQRLLHSPAPYTLLYEILHPYGFNPAQVADVLASASATPGKQFQAGEYLLTRGRTHWRLFNLLDPLTPRALLADPGTYHVHRHTFTLTELPLTADYVIPRDPNVAAIDLDKIVSPLLLRHWTTGDTFCPLGMKRSRKKVSDLFTDLKFSAKQKRDCLILQSDHDIVWIVGYRLDDRYKITPRTRRVLQITVTPATP